MAFELGKFFVSLFGDTTHVDAALKKVKGGVEGLTSAVKNATSTGLAVKGAEEAKGHLEGAAKAARSLGDYLTKLAGIDLGQILQLGTLAGAVGLIGAATKKFMNLSDEMKNTEFRFRVLGMETEENTKKLFAFGKQMQETFNVAQSEVRKLSMEALTRSINPGRYQEMTASALGLASAYNMSADRAMRLVEQLEAGNTNVLRQLKDPAFRIALEQGVSRFTLEEMVNQKIAQGLQMTKERQQTYEGQVTRLKNAFDNLYTSVSKALGVQFAPMVSKMADAMERLTKQVQEYIDKNGVLIGQTAKMAAGVLAGAFVFRHLGTLLHGITGTLGLLVPGFGTLVSAVTTGGDTPLFKLVKNVLRKIEGFLRKLPGLARKAAGLAAMSLVQPFVAAAGALTNPIGAIRGLISSIGSVATAAAGGVRLLSFGLRGLLAMTGIGLLIGLIGALAGAEDTFGETGSAAEGLGAKIKAAFGDLLKAIKPILDWLKTEGLIVFKALVASARQMIDNMKILWGDIQQAWQQVTTFLRDNFGEAITWLENTFNVKIDSIKSMWEEFTAEVAVLGLRIRQVFLMVVIGWATIFEAGRQVWDMLVALGNFIATNWKQVVIQSIATLIQSFVVLGTAVQEVGDKIGRALRGEDVSFDFTATKAAFEQLKAQASEVLRGIKMPTLDLSNVAPELQAQLKGVTEELERKKQLAREAQARDRLNAQNRGTGKTDGSSDPMKRPGVMIGGRDKAHFQDTVGFWKKVQEAGANQRAEYFQQQQLDQTREMVRILGQINQAVARPPAPPGGIVPR